MWGKGQPGPPQAIFKNLTPLSSGKNLLRAPRPEPKGPETQERGNSSPSQPPCRRSVLLNELMRARGFVIGTDWVSLSEHHGLGSRRPAAASTPPSPCIGWCIHPHLLCVTAAMCTQLTSPRESPSASGNHLGQKCPGGHLLPQYTHTLPMTGQHEYKGPAPLPQDGMTGAVHAPEPPPLIPGNRLRLSQLNQSFAQMLPSSP